MGRKRKASNDVELKKEDKSRRKPRKMTFCSTPNLANNYGMEQNQQNILRVSFPPTAFPQATEETELSFKIIPLSSDTLYHALEFALNTASRHMKTEPKIYSVDMIREELQEFILKPEIWSKYSHHVYLQHQKSLPSLRDLDLSLPGRQEQAKNVYKQYLLSQNQGGSFLELMFASMKYNFSAVLLQFMEEPQEFYVYHLNLMGGTFRLTFLNVGTTELGKWRYAENWGPTGEIPSGIYSIRTSNPEQTLLELHKKEVMELGAGDSGKGYLRDPPCNLPLFNRLMSGAARLGEFSLTLGEESPGNSSAGPSLPSIAAAPSPSTPGGGPEGQKEDLVQAKKDASADHALNVGKEEQIQREEPNGKEEPLEASTSTVNDLFETLLPPRGPATSSTYAFKSLESLQECENWCKNLTKNPEPKILNKPPTISPFHFFPNNLANKNPDQEKSKGKAQVNASLKEKAQVNASLKEKAQVNASLKEKAQVNASLKSAGTFCGVSSRNVSPPVQSWKGKEGPNHKPLNFSPLDSSGGKVSVAMVQDEEFGSPQIILRFEPGAILTQEASHHLFFRPLHASIDVSSVEALTGMSQLRSSLTRTSSFEILEGTTFTLANPGAYAVCVRCSWFTE